MCLVKKSVQLLQPRFTSLYAKKAISSRHFLLLHRETTCRYSDSQAVCYRAWYLVLEPIRRITASKRQGVVASGTYRLTGESAKLGVSVTNSTVNKYRVRVRKPSSTTWNTLSKSYVTEIVPTDNTITRSIQTRDQGEVGRLPHRYERRACSPFSSLFHYSSRYPVIRDSHVVTRQFRFLGCD